MSRKSWVVRLLFIILCLLPVSALAFYLREFSKDQYQSTFAFSVSSETPKNPLDLFSSGSASPDSHILVDFIKSQQMIDLIDEKVNLFQVYNKGKFDPLYSLDEEANQEDLYEFWERMLNVYHDQSSGIVRVEVFAFDPDDTLIIANEIIDNSRDLINLVSNISEDDKLSHVRVERDGALAKLRAAQKELTDFRARFQIVDPNANLETQVQLIRSLQQKYVDALIELELMRDILPNTDTRVVQAQRKIEIIRKNIDQEKEKIGSLNSQAQGNLVSIFDRYEQLSINVELNRELYSESIRAFSSVLSETKIKDKYLAVHVVPKRPQSSQYPRRYLIFFLAAGGMLMIWFAASLVYYSMRDRV